MKRKRMTCNILALFPIMLVVQMVFSLSIADNPRDLSENTPTSFVGPTEESPTVFIDPDKIVKDYFLDPGHQIGDTFQIHVNISDVTDLFAWNVNATWNPAILNFTKLVSYGDFLAQTTSPHGTSRIWDIIKASNETGYAAIAETILGDYPGINGSGRLVTIEFLIVGYGSTDLTIDINGTSPTELLDSDIDSISFTAIDSYFRNKCSGDIDGDLDCDYDDFLIFAASYLKTSGQPGYNPEADMEYDGDVDYDDFLIFAANYLKTFP